MSDELGEYKDEFTVVSLSGYIRITFMNGALVMDDTSEKRRISAIISPKIADALGIKMRKWAKRRWDRE